MEGPPTFSSWQIIYYSVISTSYLCLLLSCTYFSHLVFWARLQWVLGFHTSFPLWGMLSLTSVFFQHLLSGRNLISCTCTGGFSHVVWQWNVWRSYCNFHITNVTQSYAPYTTCERLSDRITQKEVCVVRFPQRTGPDLGVGRVLVYLLYCMCLIWKDFF